MNGEINAELLGEEAYLDDGTHPDYLVDGEPLPVREERLEKGIPHPEEVWHAAEQLRSAISK